MVGSGINGFQVRSLLVRYEVSGDFNKFVPLRLNLRNRIERIRKDTWNDFGNKRQRE